MMFCVILLSKILPAMSGSHFDTTHESERDRERFEAQAKFQENQILALFRRAYVKRTSTELAPSTVHQRLGFLGFDYPITSVRRGMTNLANRGKLEKTSKKKTGPYGRPEYLWKYVPDTSNDGVQGELFNR